MAEDGVINTTNNITRVSVPAATTLGEPFGFDAAAYLEDRPEAATATPTSPGTEFEIPFSGQTENFIGYEALSPSEQLAQVENVASQFMSGQLPQDVSAQIRRSAAERSVQGGYGGTELARNLTLRDIGLTSLQTMETGAKLGLGATEIRTKREMSDRDRLLQAQTSTTNLFETARQFDTASAQFQAGFNEQQRQFDEQTRQFALSFNEGVRQFNDEFAATLRSLDDSAASMVMSALGAQAANRSFRLSQENQLIIANSQTDEGIQGLQANLDSMANLFDNFNEQYQALINLYLAS